MPTWPRSTPRPPGEERPRRLPHQGRGGVPQGALLRVRPADHRQRAKGTPELDGPAGRGLADGGQAPGAEA
eukprot:529912-Alexandrium_andersonii.AAC.1